MRYLPGCMTGLMEPAISHLQILSNIWFIPARPSWLFIGCGKRKVSYDSDISYNIDPGISRDMDLYFEKTEKSAGRYPRHHFLDLFFCHSDPDQSVSADRGLTFRAAGHLFHGQHGLFDHYFCPSAAGVSAYHQVFPDGPSDQNSGGGAGAS